MTSRSFAESDLRKRVMLITVLLLTASPLFAKRKDDVVSMKNGDTFTGEIKGLQYGELIFKSDYMKDSVHLDWQRVETLKSKDAFIVALSNGHRITGRIEVIGIQSKQGFKVVTDDSVI